MRFFCWKARYPPFFCCAAALLKYDNILRKAELSSFRRSRTEYVELLRNEFLEVSREEDSSVLRRTNCLKVCFGVSKRRCDVTIISKRNASIPKCRSIKLCDIISSFSCRVRFRHDITKSESHLKCTNVYTTVSQKQRF